MSDHDGFVTRRALTVGMKRKQVVKVLKSAMQDAQREVGRDRVTGIFGLVIHEDGEAHLISALTVDELRVVMRAVPEALNRIAHQFVKGRPQG